MKGQPSASASLRPSVDLPAPRSPTSAIRRPRSIAAPRAARLSISSASAGSSARGVRARTSRMLGHRRGAPVAAREQFDDRNVERLRDRCEHDHGRVALSALDLREIALGGAGRLRELAARHAALGAGEPHQSADRGDERAVTLALGRGRGPLRLHFRLDCRHDRPSANRHYSSCNIMHVAGGVNAPAMH